MKIRARFPGLCLDCGSTIPVGALVDWTPKVGVRCDPCGLRLEPVPVPSDLPRRPADRAPVFARCPSCGARVWLSPDRRLALHPVEGVEGEAVCGGGGRLLLYAVRSVESGAVSVGGAE